MEELMITAHLVCIFSLYSFCYSAKSRHPDCVVCHPLINRLAENLLFGRPDHSVLTCYQTGLPMNEDNPPMALPNGYVYSKRVRPSLAT